jgi:hypothetical protein
MKNSIFILIFSLLLHVSCSNRQNNNSADETVTVKKTTGVSIFDYSANGLQVLKDFNDAKSHQTYVKLGESVTYLGETETDTVNKREYIKIELSDGTTGWARKEYIILDAQPAAIMKKTEVYERPDILTKSAKKVYQEIDVVALIEERDEWCNVIGRNKLNSGWVLKENISTNKEDVGMVILARKEIFDDKGNIVESKILEFVNNAPFPGSAVSTILRDRVIQKVETEARQNQNETIELNEDDSWD